MMNSFDFVILRTDLFSFDQPDEEIGQWLVGADCAGWFYARLLPVPGVRPYCDPCMEDWGWIFAVAVDDVRVWVSVWEYFPIEGCFLLGLEAKKRVFKRSSAESLKQKQDLVGNAIDEIIKRTPGILKHRWTSENPFDSDAGCHDWLAQQC